tara:strand:- start:149 stop:379 length:231 start_codon:yes stop_codon:yes gene_type:complete
MTNIRDGSQPNSPLKGWRKVTTRVGEIIFAIVSELAKDMPVRSWKNLLGGDLDFFLEEKFRREGISDRRRRWVGGR